MAGSVKTWPYDSVTFGYDQTKYESSLAAMSEKRSESDRSTNHSRFTRMKDSVHFGDGKARDFVTSNQQIGRGGTGPQTVMMSDRQPKEVKGKVVMGYDAVKPFSESQVAYKYDPIAAKEAIAFRNQVRERSCARVPHSISWNDTIGYISESKSSFFDKSKLSVSVASSFDRKGDLSATHFILGDDALDYTTSSHIPPLNAADFSVYGKRQLISRMRQQDSVEIA
uniref:Uncharacterized protein AlNc14C451G11730 n=1 Tax=Albugo laibachii Nc14 TaxID=890382 RepID=F0WZY7_9STRA|nr:conserved hypothetical protein [Albugo laibachii Nc14]|eukprot:CCA27068.1 conserved hypothetical protein [Albugo laibachii Nc14]